MKRTVQKDLYAYKQIMLASNLTVCIVLNHRQAIPPLYLLVKMKTSDSDFSEGVIISGDPEDVNRILRAVNSHEQLVAALELALETTVPAGIYPDGPCIERHVRKEMETALAAAKGQS